MDDVGVAIFPPHTDAMKLLIAGNPLVASIADGHILVIRGSGINRDGNGVRVICNDPMGTLAGPLSKKRWCQQSPKKTNEYEGEMNEDSPQ